VSETELDSILYGVVTEPIAGPGLLRPPPWVLPEPWLWVKNYHIKCVRNWNKK